MSVGIYRADGRKLSLPWPAMDEALSLVTDVTGIAIDAESQVEDEIAKEVHSGLTRVLAEGRIGMAEQHTDSMGRTLTDPMLVITISPTYPLDVKGRQFVDQLITFFGS